MVRVATRTATPHPDPCGTWETVPNLWQLRVPNRAKCWVKPPAALGNQKTRSVSENKFKWRRRIVILPPHTFFTYLSPLIEQRWPTALWRARRSQCSSHSSACSTLTHSSAWTIATRMMSVEWFGVTVDVAILDAESAMPTAPAATHVATNANGSDDPMERLPALPNNWRRRQRCWARHLPSTSFPNRALRSASSLAQQWELRRYLSPSSFSSSSFFLTAALVLVHRWMRIQVRDRLLPCHSLSLIIKQVSSVQIHHVDNWRKI